VLKRSGEKEMITARFIFLLIIAILGFSLHYATFCVMRKRLETIHKDRLDALNISPHGVGSGTINQLMSLFKFTFSKDNFGDSTLGMLKFLHNITFLLWIFAMFVPPFLL